MLQIQNMEMRSEVNFNIEVNQNGMQHSTIPSGIHTPILGFLPLIILEIFSKHNYSTN